MHPHLTQLQADVVNAFLDAFAGERPWRQGFVHAEFALLADTPQSLAEAFLVPAAGEPGGPHYVPLDWPVLQALEALHAGYREAGQPFTQLDLVIAAADGRYRFSFSRVPSLRLAGEPDPAAGSYLAERYAELAGEG